MLSKTQIDKLGERLRKGTPADGDEDLFAELMDAYGAALEEVRAVLVELRVPGVPFAAPSTRVKTMGTLGEKLVREKNRLSTIQDLAGARIILPSTSLNLLTRLRGSLQAQDELVAAIASRFEGSRISDRRASPSHGYRAVHIVVRSASLLPVEIQVRTAMQHRWAEQFERFADRFGRELRYGGPPSLTLGDAAIGVATRVVEAMMLLSENTALAELGEQAWVQLALNDIERSGSMSEEAAIGLANFRAIEETSDSRLNAVVNMMEVIE